MADFVVNIRAKYDELKQAMEYLEQKKREVESFDGTQGFDKLTREYQNAVNKVTELATSLNQMQSQSVSPLNKALEDMAKGVQIDMNTLDDSMKKGVGTLQRLSELAEQNKQSFMGLNEQNLNQIMTGANSAAGGMSQLLISTRDINSEMMSMVENARSGLTDLPKDVQDSLKDSIDSTLDGLREENQRIVETLNQLEQQKNEIKGFVDAQMAMNADGTLTISNAPDDSYNERMAALDSEIAKLRERQQVIAESTGQSPETLNQTNEEYRRLTNEIQFCNDEIKVLNGTMTQQEAEQRMLARAVEEGTRPFKSAIDSVKEFGAAGEKMAQMEDAIDSQRISAQMEDIAAKMMKARQVAEELTNTYNQMRNRVAAGDTTITMDQFDRADVNAEKAKAELAALVEEYNKLAEAQKRTGPDAPQLSIRTQIRQAREEMIRLADEVGTIHPKFQQAAIAAGALQRKMNLANASMRYFANPIRHLAALKTGLQGVAGAAGLVTGVMGLFNANSEKSAEIQKKVQSVLAVIVGLETTYNLIKKSSTFVLAINEIRTWAMAKAMTAEATATEGAAIAQEHLNVAMASNPIGAVLVVVATVAAAVWGLCSAFSGLSEEEEKQIEKQKEWEKVTYDVRTNAAATIVKQRDAYDKLKKSYEALGDSMQAKVKFIKENATEMENLGLKVNNVDDADNVFIKKTNNVIKALGLRATYAAYAAVKMQLLQQQIAGIALDKRVHIGDKVDVGFAKKAEEWGKENGKGELYGGLVIGSNFNVDTQKEADYINAYKNYLYKKEIQDIINQLNIEQSDVKLQLVRQGVTDLFNDIDGGGKRGSGKTGTKRGKGGRTEQEVRQINREKEKEHEEELKLAEEKRKQMISDSQKEEELRIKLMKDGAEKTRRQRNFNNQKEISDIEEQARQRQLAIIAAEKKAFDEQEDKKAKDNKKYLKKNYYETEQYKAHYAGGDDSNPNNLRFNKDIESWMEVNRILTYSKQFTEQQKEFNNYAKEFEKFYSKRLQIENKYEQERKKIQDNALLMGLSKDAVTTSLNQLEIQKQQELKKQAFDEFKGNPLYQIAMQSNDIDLSAIDPQAFEKVAKEMKKQMENAANENPADFKAFSDAYMKITDKLIEKNPFKALKESVKELDEAQREAKINTEGYQRVLDRYTDGNGNITKIITKDGIVDNTLEQDKENLAKAEKEFQEKNQQGLSSKELEVYAKNVDKARKKLIETNIAYSHTEELITAAQNKANNSIQKSVNAQNKNQKATNKVIETTKKWGEAIKQAASLFNSPIADAVTGMVDLASTTLDSIKAIKDAGDSSAKGLDKVANAVQKAVAILAIIQMAWKVINTIANIFTSAEEKRYQEKIKLLEAQISSIDYAFNLLKKTMDETWGTEAIDNYIDAVESLDKKIELSNEKIQTQAQKSSGGFFGVGGYHSLQSKQDDAIRVYEYVNGVNLWKQGYDEMLKKGYNIQGTEFEWLYNMTPEQLQYFMSTPIGQQILSILASVDSKVYSGSQWLQDLQAYANLFDEQTDLIEKNAEKLNGISLEGLKDELENLATATDLSLNSINNSFDQFMRTAVWNRVRSKYEDDLEDWYTKLDKLNNDYAAGNLSESEYRQQLAQLRKEYKDIINQANEDYKTNLDNAGVNAEDVEQGGSSGGFESMSEDTGTELNGRFAAMQSQMTYIADNTETLKNVVTQGVSIADEIRTIQVNSYLELKAIQENTFKIISPINEMRETLKQVKDNTDKL